MCQMMACHLFGRHRFLSSIVEGSLPHIIILRFAPLGANSLNEDKKTGGSWLQEGLY